MIGRILLLGLLLAPMLAAQEDTCPTVFPPDACDTGAGVGVTATAPPPNCSPCFTVEDISAAMGRPPPSINQNCQVSTGGATQFLLTATAVNGPPPQVVGIYLTESNGSCSRTDLLGTVSVPAGTFSAEDLAGRCKDTLEYWTLTVPNEVCESVS